MPSTSDYSLEQCFLKVKSYANLPTLSPTLFHPFLLPLKTFQGNLIAVRIELKNSEYSLLTRPRLVGPCQPLQLYLASCILPVFQYHRPPFNFSICPHVFYLRLHTLPITLTEKALSPTFPLDVTSNIICFNFYDFLNKVKFCCYGSYNT